VSGVNNSLVESKIAGNGNRLVSIMQKRLSKSDFISYLECPGEFWLRSHKPSLFNINDTLESEHLRQQGYEVQRMARQLLRFESTDASVEFERVFETDAFYARSDIVRIDAASRTVDLYEIKSSTTIKDEHIEDLAFQKLAAKSSGTSVGRCFLVTLNGEYIRRGAIDIEQLFMITDVTERVDSLMALTEQKAAEALGFLDTVPKPSLTDYCDAKKLDCEFVRHHFPNLPEYTVFDIARLNNGKRRQLLADGIVDIADVPTDFPLSDKQRRQVEAARSGEVVIDREEIAKRVESWQYPLHFLDYETFSYAIPPFDDIKPFQHMCFQYSLHTIDAPGGRPRHVSFLSRDEETPARAMAESLVRAMSGGIGTVFVWYEQFEKGRNSEMAAMYPEFSSFFNEVNSRMYDLMKIFSDHLYIHPGFKGRTSIKKVLPVLRPQLSYAELGIGDGMTASINWYRTRTWNSIGESERQKIFQDLEAYCHLDTLAMVEIFNEIVSL